MTPLRTAWPALDRRLRRYLVANFGALSAATLTLAGVYLAGYSNEIVEYDLVVMAITLALNLLGIPFLMAWGPQGALTALWASTQFFSFAIVWSTPWLSPLAVCVVLLPVMIAHPYLGRTLLRLFTAATVLTSAGVVVVAELRRAASPGLELENAIAVGVSMPFVVVVIVYAVSQSYRQLASQAGELRDSRVRMAQVADATRRGLERDLHDGAQQRLIGMSVQIGQAEQALLAGHADQALDRVREVGAQNMEAIQELRELARGIYPPLLAERGLAAAVRSAARRSAIACTVDADEVPRHPPEVESAAYFCILEALQNAGKHSSADAVRVTITSNPTLRFEVADDGCGFDPESVRAEGGLLGMQVRVAAVGGRLEVDSAVGRGTRIRGRLP